MEKENKFGLMEQNFKEIIKLEKNKEMVNLLGPMVHII